MCLAGLGVRGKRVMKILLVARPRRQTALACGLALSFMPLQTRVNRREWERTRANAICALCPDLA
eukprot:2805767-Pleurochrysis_carterae.AAC.1